MYQWKWVIIALHNSVQASMVLALAGTATFNVYTKENKKEWIRALNSQLTNPQQKLPKREYLAPSRELYDRIKSEEMKMYVHSKSFISTEWTDYAMGKLIEFRNKFTHFPPEHWYLELIGLPGICKEVLSIIDFLIFGSGNIHCYDDQELENLKELILEIRGHLDELERNYKN